MYDPHPDDRIEAAFQRFLRILRGIQLLHNPDAKPVANVSVYEWDNDVGQDGRTWWMVSVPRRSKHHLIAPQPYCFIVRTQFTALIRPRIEMGYWPVGTIMGSRMGKPDLNHVLGSLFGLSYMRKEPPQVGFLPEPPPDYFMDFCGPANVSQRNQRINEAKAQEHADFIRSRKPPPPAPRVEKPSRADSLDTKDLLGLLELIQEGGIDATQLAALARPRSNNSHRDKGPQSKQGQAWDQMVQRKKVREGMEKAGADPEWLQDFLSDVADIEPKPKPEKHLPDDTFWDDL